MRKKLLTVTLAILMVCNLAACGGNAKDSEETAAVKTVEEETSVEKTVEAPATEEPATVETTVVEEVTTTEYQLTQMDTGFYGGIAWATVSGDAGSKHVLINKDLQAVYELPEGMETGDIFDGKAVVAYADQSVNPGFIVLGTDGNVLYECTDVLCADDYPCYNVNFTKDGSMIYEKHESGLTGNKVTACILNSNYEKVAELEIPMGYLVKYGDFTDAPRKYVYLSDGIYGCYCEQGAYLNIQNMAWALLNVKENTAVDLLTEAASLRMDNDIDRCAGLSAYIKSVNEGEIWAALMGDAVDYNGISDKRALYDLVKSNGKEYLDRSSTGNLAYFNHGYIMYTRQYFDDNAGNYGDNVEELEGFVLPDFGAPITNFQLSDDGKYASLVLKGANYNYYSTVISSDGQALYEPVKSDQLEGKRCVSDGYILTDEGTGLTPEGKEFQLGDGTALTGIGENSTAYIETTSSDKARNFRLSDGYIVCQKKLYRLDGTEVTTVTGNGTTADQEAISTADKESDKTELKAEQTSENGNQTMPDIDLTGTWYDPTGYNTAEFTFNGDGTGTINRGSSTDDLTYSISGETINVLLPNNTDTTVTIGYNCVYYGGSKLIRK